METGLGQLSFGLDVIKLKWLDENMYVNNQNFMLLNDIFSGKKSEKNIVQLSVFGTICYGFVDIHYPFKV